MKYQRKNNMGFDHFLIREWCDCREETAAGECTETARKQAYQTFRQAIKGDRPADLHTMRRWFGLEGTSKPNREMLFHIAVSLELSVEQTQKYLKKGLLLPGIQVNDHREFIYLYAIEHHLDWQMCQKMIRFYEKHLPEATTLLDEKCTQKLWDFYDTVRLMEPEDFLVEMGKRASYFKGYSKNVLEHYLQIQEELKALMREEALQQLESLLQSSSFKKWCEENHISPDQIREEEVILRYLQKENRRVHSAISKEEVEDFRKMARIAYGKGVYQSDILTEIYAAAMPNGKDAKEKYQKDRVNHIGIRLISDKYFSDLLHIAEQKEREINLLQQFYQSSGEEQNKILGKLRHQKQRCHIIEREDLLPLLHYLAQKKYTLKMDKEETGYQKDAAAEYFEEMANTVLEACQMEPLDRHYRLDALLLSSFKEEEMFSISDLIEGGSGERDI